MKVVQWFGWSSETIHYQDPKCYGYTLCGMKFIKAAKSFLLDYPHHKVDCKRCLKYEKERV